MSTMRERLMAAAKNRPAVDLPVPEWGTAVRIRRLTAKEILDYRRWQKTAEVALPDEAERAVEAMVRILRLAIVDDAGDPVFSDSPEDTEVITDFDLGGLERVFKFIMDRDGQSAAGRETIQGNSETAVCASPTASPSPSANHALTNCSTN